MNEVQTIRVYVNFHPPDANTSQTTCLRLRVAPRSGVALILTIDSGKPPKLAAWRLVCSADRWSSLTLRLQVSR